MFINKGKQDGVQEGQEYAIYYDEELDFMTKKIDIGTFIVLHTEETTATALITNSKKAIRPGQKFRTPVM